MPKLTPKKPSRRGAPPIAAENAAAALKNIETKFNVMQAALRVISSVASDEAQELVRVMPKSVRQFNQWNSDVLPSAWKKKFSAFTGNSHKTLMKNEEHFKLLGILLGALSKAKPSKLQSKIETIAKKKAEVDEAILLKRIALRELDIERRLCEKLAGLLEESKAELASLQNEAQTALEALKAENEEMREALGITGSLSSTKALLLLEKIVSGRYR